MRSVSTLMGPHRLMGPLHEALERPLHQQSPDDQDGQGPPPPGTPECMQS